MKLSPLLLFSIPLLFTSFSLSVLASPLRVNGCPREDNKIIITGFSSGKCEQGPCVETGTAILEEVAFSGCTNVTCTSGPAPSLFKRAGQVVASLPRGGHGETNAHSQTSDGADTAVAPRSQGTCALSTATQSAFSCSDEKKIIVTVDLKGAISFESQGEEEEAPSAFFSSKIDKDGVS